MIVHCPNCGEKLPETTKRRAAYKHFYGALISWQQLFQRAVDFATSVGPERLISISHSEDHNKGVVTVWYWLT